MVEKVKETVEAFLDAAGLEPSEAELGTLVASYEFLKPGIESLYAVAETRYGAPALIFSATPVFAEWS